MFRSALLLIMLALFASVVSGQECSNLLSEQQCLTVVTTTPAGSTLTVNFNYDPYRGKICSLISGSIGIRVLRGTDPTAPHSDRLTSIAGRVQVNVVGIFVEASNLHITFTTDNGAGSLGLSGGDAIVSPGYGTLAKLNFQGLFSITNEQVKSADTSNDCGAVTGDPVFHGFHGQIFSVKGEHGRVFNLLSSTDFLFNNRFVELSQNESMSASQMRSVRAASKHSKLLDLVSGAKADDAARPPVTAAWSHAGTYMGESGLRLGESQLYIAPGAYALGFSAVTLDGAAVPVSSKPIELDGDMTVTRLSAFKVKVTTADVHFTIVNSDRFVNIEHVAVDNMNAQLSGLLGQTAGDEWEVKKADAEWKLHLENDFKLHGNDIFGADFDGQQF